MTVLYILDRGQNRVLANKTRHHKIPADLAVLTEMAAIALRVGLFPDRLLAWERRESSVVGMHLDSFARCPAAPLALLRSRSDRSRLTAVVGRPTLAIVAGPLPALHSAWASRWKRAMAYLDMVIPVVQ